MRKIEFYRHSVDKNDIRRVSRVLRSLFLTTGAEVERFEKLFSQYLRMQHSIGLTSCTAGLHLSLLALGIGAGDEVITSPMSFCATANSIIHAGARPVFVDVEEETGNMNPELIERAITKRTKAIVPVHLYGQMCDMKSISKIAKRYRLKIIEDAAHAIEAERDGIKVGGLSDAACFSFYATKNITSGEGGAVATNSKKLAELVRLLRLHGMDRSAVDRYSKRFKQYDMPRMGWKYNMDNIQASLLIGQLQRIDKLWRMRDKVWKTYERHLRGAPSIRLPRVLKSGRHARHLFTVQVPERKRNHLISALQENGIGVAVNFKPIHLLQYYRRTYGYKKKDYPVAEKIGASTISLPLYPSMKEDDIIYVVNTLKAYA